jgi:hypothetical protein
MSVAAAMIATGAAAVKAATAAVEAAMRTPVR